MPDFATLKNNLNDAGSAYKGFLERQRNDHFFTQRQKNERRRTFLENHVELFNDYFLQADSRRALNALNDNGVLLAWDVASEFPESTTAQTIRRIDNEIEGGQDEDRNIIRNENPGGIRKDGQDHAKPDESRDSVQEGTGEIDLQGQALKNYRRRTERKAVVNETVHEGDIQETKSQKALKEGITDAQKNGMREICAYLYRSTKKHQKLVDGIAGRTPREKLLMFYIIENDKRHNVTQEDIFRSQQFVPSLEKFEKKIWYRKHIYKFGGKNINWDLISDASTTAFQAQGLLGIIGMAGGEKQDQKDDELNILKEDSKENLLIIDTSAHKDEEQEKEEKENLLNKIDEDLPVKEESQEEIIKEAEKQIREIEAMTESIVRAEKKKLAKKENDADLPNQLTELRKKLDTLNKYARKHSVLQNMALGKDIEHAKGDTGPIKWNAEGQKVSKWMVLIQGACTTANNSFKAVNGFFQNPAWSQTSVTVSTDAGVGADGIMTALNLLASVANIMSAFKSFSSGTWEDITGKSITALLSVGNTSKSGLTAARTIATLANNADWGIKGTSSIATGMKTGTAIGGIVIGSVTAGMGIYNIATAGYRKTLSTQVADYLNVIEEPVDEAEAEKREGKKQILKNIIAANRSAANRTQVSGALQAIQGGLNTASGALTLAAGATLGASTIVSLGLSGAALIVGLANVIYQKRKKGKEAVQVVDQYINMDSLYNNYLAKNMDGLRGNQRQKEIKKQGGEDKLKEKIRSEVVAVLGFPSVQKMYNYIMWQYAQTLHDLVFITNGRFVTRREWEQNLLGDINDRKEYAKLIRSLGLKLSIPKNGKEPAPGVAAIYKKLIA